MDLSPLALAYCVVVLLLAYGLRGSTGFGAAAGMPLLALVIPVKTLIPAWTLMSIASSIAILGRDRREVAFRSVLPLLPWCLLGIGVGLYFFKALDSRTLARGLGFVILAYAAYSASAMMRTPQKARPLHRMVTPVSGVLAGAVGTLFGTLSTLFFAMYLDSCRLAKGAFRATMSALLLTLGVVRGAGYWLVGEFTREALLLCAAMLPVMLVGIYIGNRVHVALSDRAFKWLVIAAMALSGAPLLFG